MGNTESNHTDDSLEEQQEEEPEVDDEIFSRGEDSQNPSKQTNIQYPSFNSWETNDLVITLQGLVLGDSKVGKTCLVQRLRGEDPFFVVPTHDSTTIPNESDRSNRNVQRVRKCMALTPWKERPEMMMHAVNQKEKQSTTSFSLRCPNALQLHVREENWSFRKIGNDDEEEETKNFLNHLGLHYPSQQQQTNIDFLILMIDPTRVETLHYVERILRHIYTLRVAQEESGDNKNQIKMKREQEEGDQNTQQDRAMRRDPILSSSERIDPDLDYKIHLTGISSICILLNFMDLMQERSDVDTTLSYSNEHHVNSSRIQMQDIQSMVHNVQLSHLHQHNSSPIRISCFPSCMKDSFGVQSLLDFIHIPYLQRRQRDLLFYLHQVQENVIHVSNYLSCHYGNNKNEEDPKKDIHLYQQYKDTLSHLKNQPSNTKGYKDSNHDNDTNRMHRRQMFAHEVSSSVTALPADTTTTDTSRDSLPSLHGSSRKQNQQKQEEEDYIVEDNPNPTIPVNHVHGEECFNLGTFRPPQNDVLELFLASSSSSSGSKNESDSEGEIHLRASPTPKKQTNSAVYFATTSSSDSEDCTSKNLKTAFIHSVKSIDGNKTEEGLDEITTENYVHIDSLEFIRKNHLVHDNQRELMGLDENSNKNMNRSIGTSTEPTDPDGSSLDPTSMREQPSDDVGMDKIIVEDRIQRPDSNVEEKYSDLNDVPKLNQNQCIESNTSASVENYVEYSDSELQVGSKKVTEVFHPSENNDSNEEEVVVREAHDRQSADSAPRTRNRVGLAQFCRPISIDSDNDDFIIDYPSHNFVQSSESDTDDPYKYIITNGSPTGNIRRQHAHSNTERNRAVTQNKTENNDSLANINIPTGILSEAAAQANASAMKEATSALPKGSNQGNPLDIPSHQEAEETNLMQKKKKKARKKNKERATRDRL